MVDTATPAPEILPIRHAEIFRRALSRPRVAQSPHFALHHCQGPWAAPRPSARHLSSATEEHPSEPVDKSLENPVDKVLSAPVEGAARLLESRFSLGFVVPKRLARRSVTRNLIRRQMREAVQRQLRLGPPLAFGAWVLRLRRPFEKSQFPSAASDALRREAREELSRLLRKAATSP